MKGTVSSEHRVEAPASAVWSVYSRLELVRFVNEHLSDVIKVLEVVEVDGGVGTVLKATFARGGYLTERYLISDNEKKVKEKEVIEGGLLDMGFKMHKKRVEVLEKDEASAIIRSTEEYELADQDADKAALVSTKFLEALAQTIGKYVIQKYQGPDTHL